MVHQSSSNSHHESDRNEMMRQSSSNRHNKSDCNNIPANFCRGNSGPRIHQRIELPPPPSSVSSLTWRERFEKDPSDKENGVTHVKKSTIGLGAVVKLFKEASYEKKVFAGQRKPLGDASNGRMLLQSRAASKRELEKVQSKLSEFCWCYGQVKLAEAVNSVVLDDSCVGGPSR